MKLTFRNVLMGLFGAALGFFGLTVNAEESYFFVNQVKNKPVLEASYSRQNGTFRQGETSGNKLGIQFTRPFENDSSLWIKTGFESREVSSTMHKEVMDYNVKKNGIGLNDIEGGIQYYRLGDSYNWNYGFAGSMSPGAAQDPRLAEYSEVSNVSGLYSVAAQGGIESYVDSLAVGASAELRLYSNRYISRNGSKVWERTGNAPNEVVPTLKGFIEMPMSKDVNFGFMTSLSVSSENYYLGKLYGEWKVDNQMTALFGLSASHRLIPHVEDTNDISIGIRKRL